MPQLPSQYANGPAWFQGLYRRLLVHDLTAQLPGEPTAAMETLEADDSQKLLAHASLLALSDDPANKAVAYEVATRLVELDQRQTPNLVAAADIILSRIGNFPGRELLRRWYTLSPQSAPGAPPLLALERTAREFENSVLGLHQEPVVLTDFQYTLFGALGGSSSVSVSAPTSAGKSFVLGLDLVRRLRQGGPACVVYLVPTRALIREVTFNIRKELRKAGLEAVPVRSVPFPITKDKASHGAVFVLTQERLMSLLHSRDGDQWITALVVDEAQSIRDEARGVILQTAIEAVLLRFPEAEIHFASPLTKNPEFLLDVVHRRSAGRPFVETLSPVSQNLILVSPLKGKPKVIDFHLLTDGEALPLGQRHLSVGLKADTFEAPAALARLVTGEDESTILYEGLPAGAEKLAAALVEGQPTPTSVDRDILELIQFIRAEVHGEYPLIDCLPHRVAYHYGFMPAIVRARVEDLCKAGKLQFVCCTSTLLQGVNLPVRHIIIENPKRGKGNAMERRDFLNLAGRAGRLLREFHGNVWCLRPNEWENKSYEGEPLQEIGSAMDAAMADGGTIIQKVLNNQLSGKELDYGEAALGKVYSDFVTAERSLGESPWKTTENAATLAQTAEQIAALRITLPAEVLDANRAVRPDRLQALYEHLQAQTDLSVWVPLHPGLPGTNDRMGDIIQLVHDKLGDVQNNSYKYYKQLAIKWIYGTPLKEIIDTHVEVVRARKPDQSVSTIIRDLLRDLEQDIRFRLVKYYMAYNSVLDLVFRERGDVAVADALEPFHVYLECGASDRVALNLIALGLSRPTALALRRSIQFPDDATPEDCLSKLAATDLSPLNIPGLCRREVSDLLGRP